MLPAYILKDNTSLTVVLDGQALTMANDHPSFKNAVQMLKDNDDFNDQQLQELKSLFDVAKAVEDYIDGNIEVLNGEVLYSGEAVHNVVVDKILHFMSEGLPYKPLVRFLDKLMSNPSRRAVGELYKFLEHKCMPITESGNFVAYKGVKDDFTDHYSGKFDNSVGKTLEMPRNSVCDDAEIGCSYGFHAGSYDYAKGYASGGGNLMLVEINPADVVSVPKDCDCQKLRTSKYVVVAHYEHIETPPEEEGIYGEYDDDYDGDYDDNSEDNYDVGYENGYEQAKKEILDKLKNN